MCKSMQVCVDLCRCLYIFVQVCVNLCVCIFVVSLFKLWMCLNLCSCVYKDCSLSYSRLLVCTQLQHTNTITNVCCFSIVTHKHYYQRVLLFNCNTQTLLPTCVVVCSCGLQQGTTVKSIASLETVCPTVRTYSRTSLPLVLSTLQATKGTTIRNTHQCMCVRGVSWGPQHVSNINIVLECVSRMCHALTFFVCVILVYGVPNINIFLYSSHECIMC